MFIRDNPEGALLGIVHLLPYSSEQPHLLKMGHF
jgi:hypothetical protein